MTDKFELIDKYLEGSLTDDEKKEVEQLMSEDSSLADYYNVSKDMDNVMSHKRIRDIAIKIRDISLKLNS